MSRTTQRILGPIATDAGAWPPIRRRNSEDQKTLERLLSEELDAHWKAILREDGVVEEEHAELKARDRHRALDRAKYGDTKLLEEFVKNSIGPDGRPLGEVFAKFVRREVRPKHQKLPKDDRHEALDSKRLQKKTEAVWEADRAKAILERVYGRTPDDYKTRTDLIVATRRSGINQQEIRDWQKNRRCPMTLGRFGQPRYRPRSDDMRQRAAPDLGAARCVKSIAILSGDTSFARRLPYFQFREFDQVTALLNGTTTKPTTRRGSKPWPRLDGYPGARSALRRSRHHRAANEQRPL